MERILDLASKKRSGNCLSQILAEESAEPIYVKATEINANKRPSAQVIVIIKTRRKSSTFAHMLFAAARNSEEFRATSTKDLQKIIVNALFRTNSSKAKVCVAPVLDDYCVDPNSVETDE